MLPRLSPEDSLTPLTREYLSALRNAGFGGDIKTDYATRLITATDNSVYQVLPQAVIYPESPPDIQLALSLLGRTEFYGVSVSPRGGGTGTNGQSLTDGVVIDVSRYLNAIGEMNLEERWIWVEPGVVLDQLNAHLKPHGVFFAPNLSPSSRATLGGMINTDASGKGSRIYGKTSEHVLELDLVLLDGTTWTSKAVTLDELRELQQRDDRIGAIYREADQVVSECSDAVAAHFPKMKRFLTGYDLAHVWSADREHFDLNRLISGSEGTLAIITAAKVKLTPLPQYRQLVAIRYAAFDDALRAAQELVETDPGAIETIDDTIVALARNDAIWSHVAHLIEDDPDAPPTKAINLVEFESHDPTAVQHKIDEITAILTAQQGQPGRATDYIVATKSADIAALWNLRKKGVGLLGATKGQRRPVAFVEDTAVPPHRLADYIREFRTILDVHGLRYGMFGHVDVGCLHVRPALNLREPDDDELLRHISDAVSKLVHKYGGVMWGEHGKGYRSEYVPDFFGPELYPQLRKIKSIFDARNQLNPGKLATPLHHTGELVSVDAIKRGAFDRQIGAAALVKYETSVTCNGNGACYDWDPDHVMCPSAKVTRDRLHSPKGRAGMLREWLRLTSNAGYDAAKPATRWPALFRGRAQPDFSHEVYDVMDGCLACKACATQCPIKVDVPALRSEFFQHYHSRYRRPLRDYLLATLEPMTPWMAMVPKLFNRLLDTSWLRNLLKHWGGIVDPPQLSRRQLATELKRRKAPSYEPQVLAALSETEKQRTVLLVQDVFTSFYDTPVILSTYDLLTRLGFRVVVLPFRPNGKGLHIRGFLRWFKSTAEKNAKLLHEAAQLEIPLVGLDPAVTLSYRDEYRHLELPFEFEVSLLPEWFHTQLPRLIQSGVLHQGLLGGEEYAFFGHCTERTAAPHTQKQWQDIFAAFGLQLHIKDVGCCGMCGVFGHESHHVDESLGVFRMSWEKHLPRSERARRSVVTPGHSCRHQVERAVGFTPEHPCEILLRAFKATSTALTEAQVREALADMGAM